MSPDSPFRLLFFFFLVRERRGEERLRCRSQGRSPTLLRVERGKPPSGRFPATTGITTCSHPDHLEIMGIDGVPPLYSWRAAAKRQPHEKESTRTRARNLGEVVPRREGGDSSGSVRGAAREAVVSADHFFGRRG